MAESLHFDSINFAKRYPATQRVIEHLEESVAAANTEELKNELSNFKDSIMEALMDGFLLLDSNHARISHGVPEAEIGTLAIALQEAPSFRNHHSGILLAVLTDIANQARLTLDCTQREIVESFQTARKPELISLSPRAQQYYEAFRSIWKNNLGIRSSSSELKGVKGVLTLEQSFALNFLVFARVAETDLGTDAEDKEKLKVKIKELIMKDSVPHKEAVTEYFPRLKIDKRKSFHSTAKREVGRNGSNWWERLEKLL